MKERVAAFERRTGERYAPPALAAARSATRSPRARAARRSSASPAPRGCRRTSRTGSGSSRRPGGGHLWLTSRPTGAYPRPVDLFGTLAVLQPLRLQPCRTHCFTHTRDNWIALDRAVDPEEIAWIPPSLVRWAVSLDRVRTAAEARRRFGAGYDGRARAASWTASRPTSRSCRSCAARALRARRGTGAPCPAAERRALLARHGAAAAVDAGVSATAPVLAGFDPGPEIRRSVRGQERHLARLRATTRDARPLRAD